MNEEAQTRELVDVEVACASPAKQVLIPLRLPRGATVGDAIAASGVARQFAGTPIDALQVGIWGRLVERDHAVRSGDRVEIYRPLQIEPREARRELARAGKTMGQCAKTPKGPD